MASKIIHGERTTTVVYDTFSPFGQLPVSASPREKTEEEKEAAKRANRIIHADVLKEEGWTPEDFDEAKQFLFPRPIARHMSGRHDGQSIYSRKDIAAWRARVRALAAKLK